MRWSILRKIRAALRGVVGAHPTPRCSPAAALALFSDAPSAICCCCMMACMCARTHSLDDDYCLNELAAPPAAHTFRIIFKTAARTPAPPRRTPGIHTHTGFWLYICVHAINLNNWAVHVPRAAHRQSIHSPHAKAKSRPVRIGASRRRVCCAGLRGRRESGTILQAN